MTTGQLLLFGWKWMPSVLIGLAALTFFYLKATRFRFNRQTWLFLAGVFGLLLALISPIHTLGDHYLFSAHMLQHLLLLEAAPILLILGLPASLAATLRRSPRLRRLERGIEMPVAAWLIGIGTMAAWHLPLLYNATMANMAIHDLEHVLFLLTALVFWWPVFAPLPESRMAAPTAALYLFAAGAANCLLGIVLTFAPVGLYPAYLHPMDMLGILPLLRQGWGLTPAADQQLGGMIMWVPGCLVYVLAAVGTLARWLGEPEEEEAVA